MSSVAEKTLANIGILESALGQKIPVNDRSFLYVMSRTDASLAVAIDKKAELALKENLATTASRSGLIEIGREVLGRDPYEASPADVMGSISVSNGAVIPSETTFVSSETGLIYSNPVAVVGGTGTESMQLICSISGGSGSVSIGSIMTIQSPLAGVGGTATVSSINSPGVSEEGTEEYRQKVLDEERAQGGGSNLADYRIWGQEVLNVARVYPYSGHFNGQSSINTGGPSSRTVFVQATSDIDPDGNAPQYMLDAVKSSILVDPSTGIRRVCAGVPDSTLDVKSTVRKTINVTITGTSLSWSSDITEALELALFNYMDTLKPAIDGLDPVAGRTNMVTSIDLANVIHDVTIQYGVNASTVYFAVSGVSNLTSYQLAPGQLAKLGTVTYL